MSMTNHYSGTPLTEKEWNDLQELVIHHARRTLIGRRFLDIYGPLGGGVQAIMNDVYEESDVGTISLHGDTLEVSNPVKRENLTIPLLYKDFKLYWRDIAHARTLDIPIDFSTAANAATQLALLEDDLIFNGSEQFNIKGLMNVKGRITHIRGDWKKTGHAFQDIVEARNKLMQMGHTGPYALIVSPQLYALMHRVHQGTNVLEIEHIRELVTDGVYQSPVIKGDAGVLIATGRQNVDLAIAEDFDIAYMDEEQMNHLFRIYETIVPRIKRPSAICTLEDPKSS
ncbi:family 1 encapsulin nanocompartment shell protein [Calidifontibacillus erzurumensis]|uniref:Type 1 encapsulin shell protein n=1 Tax=Calidifontibacillus erzurumensis TaxID=2741433 RepID=A0A8J8KA31_9BACI|nr:family 1 encapsulin nanocompartment shell protein [Calidifontibacillus erzurumensis]NSL50242.1 bacteriocin family protein [Calidifontibacillus erzurumensis]